MASDKVYTVDEFVSLLKTEPIVIIPRQVNKDYRYSIGTTYEEQISFIRTSLRACHCYEGPVDDDNPNYPGKVYKFKVLYQETYWSYIKGKYDTTKSGNKIIKIISFHEEEL